MKTTTIDIKKHTTNKLESFIGLAKTSLISFAISLTAGIASAEDIEIYQQDVIAEIESETINQQVLFVLDSSGSMSFGVGELYSGDAPQGTNIATGGADYCNDFVFLDVRENGYNGPKTEVTGDESAADFEPPLFYNSADNNALYFCRSKMSILRIVMSELVETEDFDFDFGIVKFNAAAGSRGGSVIAALTERDDDEILSLQQGTIQTMETRGGTPLAESVYEGYLYLAGERRAQATRGFSDTAALSLDSEVYNSPLDNQCQTTSVVALTDGLPNGDIELNQQMRDLVGLSGGDECSLYPAAQNTDPGLENCLPELAGYMADTGINVTVNNQVQNHKIRTYTVAFDLPEDSDLLPDSANRGRPAGSDPAVPGHFTANDALSLRTSFESILLDVQNVESDSFAAPAVSVSAFNSLQFSDSLYYALFNPSTGPRWDGNVKKYRIQGSGNNVEIVDLNGAPATDPNTGFFNETSQSFWSAEVDGSDVSEGGFASNLTNANTIYADLGGSTPTQLTVAILNAQADIGQIGIDTAAQDANQDLIARWTLGQDEFDPSVPNFYTADAIHSAPFVIAYGNDSIDAKEIVFSTSNRGLLHAIDAETGVSRWSYIPDEGLLSNLGDYYNNVGSDHVYGLDGPSTQSITFDQSNGAPDGIDKAYIFTGQRRGGSKYFAIDVSNGYGSDSGNVVEKLWTIDGGIVNTEFENMGQTWAQPISTQINYCSNSSDDDTCALTEVVILSGGYDTQYDSINSDDNTVTLNNGAGALAGNVVGNAIYIVAAEDSDDGRGIIGGELLWIASDDIPAGVAGLDNNDMVHSFPSEPTAIDINGDGAIDLMFAVDISGRVWRFDMAATISDSNDIRAGETDEVAGGIIADYSENGVDRLFYNSIDVTLTDDPSVVNGLKYTLITGSGHLAHPLDEQTHEDRSYAVFDKNVLSPQFDADGDAEYEYNSGNTIDSSDINPITVTSATTSDLDVRVGEANEFGFYIPMTGTNEKILGSTLIVDSVAIFNSYLPVNIDPCSINIGSSNTYAINLETGVFVETVRTSGGIASDPVLIYLFNAATDENEPVVLIGQETLDQQNGLPPGVQLNNLTTPQAIKTTWWEVNREN